MNHGGAWQFVPFRRSKKAKNVVPDGQWRQGYKGNASKPYHTCSVCRAWVFKHKADDQQRCRCGSFWVGQEHLHAAVGGKVFGKEKEDIKADEFVDGETDIEAQVQAWCDHQEGLLGVQVTEDMREMVKLQLVEKAKVMSKSESVLYKESRARLEASSKAYCKADKLRQNLAKMVKDAESKLAKLKGELLGADKEAEDALAEQNKCMDEHKELGKKVHLVKTDIEQAGMDVQDENKHETVHTPVANERANGTASTAADGSRERSRSRGRQQEDEGGFEDLFDDFLKEHSIDETLKKKFGELREKVQQARVKKPRTANAAVAKGGLRPATTPASMDTVRQAATAAASEAVGQKG